MVIASITRKTPSIFPKTTDDVCKTLFANTAKQNAELELPAFFFFFAA